MEMHIWTGYPLCNTEARARAANFYGNTGYGVPYLYMDGTSISTSSPQTPIQNEMAKPSPMTDSMWGYYNTGTRKGRIYVSFRNDSTAAITGNIYFVVIEDSIDYHAANGDTLHNDVVRDYLPNEVGSSFTIPVGQTATKNDTFTISASWNVNRCHILAWIQRTSSPRTIFQASMKKVTNLPIAIEEEDLDAAGTVLRLQPNPCVTGTRFSLNVPAVGRYGLRIYNAVGRMVWEHSGVTSDQAWNEYWDRSDMNGRRVSAGVYLYRFDCGKARQNGTIVVQ